MARKKRYAWLVIVWWSRRRNRPIRKKRYVEADSVQEAWEKIEQELANFGGNKRRIERDMLRGSYVVWLWLDEKHIGMRSYRMRIVRRGDRVVKGVWK